GATLLELPERKREAFALLIDACNALRRENHEVLYASMIKDTMKRKQPSFDESYYGYRTFTHLLEDADNNMVVDIERNPKSGTYVVTGYGNEGETGNNRESEPPRPPRGPRRRRSRS
ncbi:MAG TPA: OST-HTH/LOTUS domain-containing protein, partial [Isosphaeraceae bacterium]|nr:OST-HTH/LOTUS domain-containing protein [Isosphaeraceae bacterium]